MRIWAAVTCSMLLGGCGSGPSKVDVSGTWEATVTNKTCTSQNLNRCGGVEEPHVLTLTQTGGTVSGRAGSLVMLQGRLDGENLSLDGAGSDPIGGIMAQQWRLRVSGDRITGTLSDSFISPVGQPDTQSRGTRARTGDVTGIRRF